MAAFPGADQRNKGQHIESAPRLSGRVWVGTGVWRAGDGGVCSECGEEGAREGGGMLRVTGKGGEEGVLLTAKGFTLKGALTRLSEIHID